MPKYAQLSYFRKLANPLAGIAVEQNNIWVYEHDEVARRIVCVHKVNVQISAIYRDGI